MELYNPDTDYTVVTVCNNYTKNKKITIRIPKGDELVSTIPTKFVAGRLFLKASSIDTMGVPSYRTSTYDVLFSSPPMFPNKYLGFNRFEIRAIKCTSK